MSAFTPPFLLIRANGETIEFASLADLATATIASRMVVEDYHVRAFTTFNHEVVVERAEWIVRDDVGCIVTADDIKQAQPVRTHYWERLAKTARHCEALGLPIPRTGKRRFSYRRYMRQPAHLGAHREDAGSFIFADDDIPAHNRNRLRVKLPPTAWDDITRKSWNTRSWKKHRSTQYQPV